MGDVSKEEEKAEIVEEKAGVAPKEGKSKASSWGVLMDVDVKSVGKLPKAASKSVLVVVPRPGLSMNGDGLEKASAPPKLESPKAPKSAES